MVRQPWTYDEHSWCTWPWPESPVPQSTSKTNLKAFCSYFFGNHDFFSGVLATGRSSTTFVTIVLLNHSYHRLFALTFHRALSMTDHGMSLRPQP